MKIKLNTAKKVGFLLIAVSIICGIIAGIDVYVGKNFVDGKIARVAVVEKVRLSPEPDLVLVGLIYYPKENNRSSYPAVFIQHGLGGRKGNMKSFALNFVKRGFIAVTFDLRGHGESIGYCTFGNMECYDMVYEMNYLTHEVSGKKIINGRPINISQIVLIGHSLGAETVCIASYMTGVNCTVLIAPPTSLAETLLRLSDYHPELMKKYLRLKNPFDNPEFFENISLLRYVENRSAADPRPKNMLLITGKEDVVVPSADVYRLFKAAVHMEHPLNWTVYGNFSDYTAVCMNVYPDAPHPLQQYPFKTPEICRDVINWTEHAIYGDKADELPPIEVDTTNLNLYWDLFQVWYMASGLLLLGGIMVLLNTRKKTGLAYRWTIPPELMVPVLPFGHYTHKGFGDNYSPREAARPFYINLVFVSVLIWIFGIIGVYSALPNIPVGNFITAVFVHFLSWLSLALGIFLAVIYFKAIRRIRAERKAGRERKVNYLLLFGIATDWKALLYGAGAGILLALYYPVGIVWISRMLDNEHLLDFIIYMDDYICLALLFSVFFLIYMLFSTGYIMRYMHVLMKKAPKHRVFWIFFSGLLKFILVLTFTLLLVTPDPFFNGYFYYIGVRYSVKFVTILIIAGVLYAVFLLTDLFWELNDTIMVPYIFCVFTVPWYLMSMLPVI